MNNTTNSWEGKWNDYIDKRQEWFDFTSKANIAIELRDFVRTLLHDTEIAAREKEKDSEPISAQIEGKKKNADEFVRLCAVIKNHLLTETTKGEEIGLSDYEIGHMAVLWQDEISTAHRNGVIEGKRECVLAMKKYFDEIDEEDWKSWEVSSKLSLLGEN